LGKSLDSENVSFPSRLAEDSAAKSRRKIEIGRALDATKQKAVMPCSIACTVVDIYAIIEAVQDRSLLEDKSNMVLIDNYSYAY
jgi:hypothetical protein